jgi:hypothetical protein
MINHPAGLQEKPPLDNRRWNAHFLSNHEIEIPIPLKSEEIRPLLTEDGDMKHDGLRDVGKECLGTP